ncbi:hypothetical protein SCLCIDRAFT_131182 [Scleroderma citrinum Foug A]|uniref:Uncharacterized protein n=1 Tax=Scleroderma citrinum Foug A TaxID=1036808 RepID=A0A0C2ZXG5_9AGAM|nr:hypothetical protein SCLCIDRAFT_131182 [Scleroderma citrinum Foug A]
MTAFQHPHDTQKSPKNHLQFPHNLSDSDAIFHLAPFTYLLENTIAPTYSTPPADFPNFSPGNLNQPGDDLVGDDDELADMDSQECQQGPSVIVPTPSNSAEAYLLLETAHADQQVQLTRKNLALQVVHHNMLMLQYNCLLLDKAHQDLHTANHFMGCICFAIRRSGIPVAFKYAMREDYSACTSGWSYYYWYTDYITQVIY